MGPPGNVDSASIPYAKLKRLCSGVIPEHWPGRALLSRDHEVNDFPGSDQERKTADPDAYERGLSPPPRGVRADREEAERQPKESGCRAAYQPEGKRDRAETPEAHDD
jgi:hypothetical protein